MYTSPEYPTTIGREGLLVPVIMPEQAEPEHFYDLLSQFVTANGFDESRPRFTEDMVFLPPSQTRLGKKLLKPGLVIRNSFTAMPGPNNSSERWPNDMRVCGYTDYEMLIAPERPEPFSKFLEVSREVLSSKSGFVTLGAYMPTPMTYIYRNGNDITIGTEFHGNDEKYRITLNRLFARTIEMLS